MRDLLVDHDLRATFPAQSLARGLVWSEYCFHHFTDRASKWRRHRVANLPRNLDLSSTKTKAVWKTHEARGLSMRYWTIFNWVKISAFLGFKELSSNGDRRPIPPKASEQVCAT